MEFLNPYNPAYQTVTLSLDIEASVEFALLEGFVLAGSVSDIQMKVSDMHAYFLTEVSISDIQTKVKSLADPIE